jgi:hypothetical protein
MPALVLWWFLASAQFAQSATGELRLTVTDAGGLGLQSHVTLISTASQFAQTRETAVDGALVARPLPFGRYRLTVSRDGFAPFTTLLDVESALPLNFRVTLTIAPVQAEVTVNPGETLLDLRQTSSTNRVGPESLQRRLSALPGRALSDVVNTQPGWLLEANGILHPRGSEYQVQYVIDGLPLTDNRSPTFAPGFDADDVHAMSIVTGGYPAEYGRKLGGVIEVVTAGQARQGLHGAAGTSIGSFGTATGFTSTQFGWKHTTLGVSGNLARTDRYLDPPVEENFTNHGTGSNVAAVFEREFSAADRLGVVLRHGETRFLVPNELIQEGAGQRQERSSEETALQLSYQHVLSTNVLADVRGMARTLGARLSSNALSTPIAAQQDRGFREGYARGTVTAHAGAHEWKAGFDASFGSIREAFSYQLTDPSLFEPSTPPTFSFADRAPNREQALFLQDRVALGSWTINAGVRWDHYTLVVTDSAVSPRVAVAWSWPAADLVFRASYDRAFQTPAIENLLLASSPKLDVVNESVIRLPVPPSLGHFFEAGVSKRLLSLLRVDVTQFTRTVENFADDDVLLNTGVSFPMSFQRADIHGTEIKVEVPRWRALSGFASYAYMVGTGTLPMTGGLLVGDDERSALSATDRFPISQDQRHTMRARVSYELSPRAWVAVAGSYGSGLPVEFAGDRDAAIQQYGERIVDRVDFEAGRVRPSASIDASGSVTVLRTDRQRFRIQADVMNITNRLNAINFAGLFSGTALGVPRTVGVRLQLEF